ncbi:uncharacterized protein LAESUDRAFT_763870 [Laetiporus sulphureus 93-53]|uniref:Uncharacterized protein n=1 Tax=Laetiporus sulphureus 93-53 TaxID=1314785 RepID=A0A165BLJ1_9APHY|nr:uncharacterized protein LAESUDRAFT_763870 [Laetiporus sulphureus 93-53]KZT01273.1 hypothetical protein LAESUDRAFT_763870 [Laetiporus sulphureus 93-53]
MGMLECQHLKQEEVAMELGSASDGQRIKLSLHDVRHGWVREEMEMRDKDGQIPGHGQSLREGPQTLEGEADGKPLEGAPSLGQRGEVGLEQGTLDLEKDAQQKLKNIYSKVSLNMISFTEKFRQWAPKTNLSHTALIGYIVKHQPEKICNAMITHGSLRIADPVTWPEYLDLCLMLEAKFRADKAGTYNTAQPSSSTPHTRKDPDAMEVDELKELSKEQEQWLEKKLCLMQQASFQIQTMVPQPKVQGQVPA